MCFEKKRYIEKSMLYLPGNKKQCLQMGKVKALVCTVSMESHGICNFHFQSL